MTVEELFKQWSMNYYFDPETRAELSAIEDENEIRDRFYRELEFGTAGIRGVLGAGTNRMNIYVVRRVSYGIAKMIVGRGDAAMKAGIVIGYDSRNCSDIFAKEAASVFAGHGITVYMHPEICPVPVLSYSVRTLKCTAGVMITASHNPREYNGYKVYGCDGAQLPPEDCDVVTSIINKVTDYTKVPRFSFDFLVKNKSIKILGNKIKNSYFDEIKKLLVAPDRLADNASALKLVYTPIHGAGAKYVPVILKKLGFNGLSVVEEQMKPDGNFPTVNVPNPENRDVYELAVKLAEENGANLILATDPDSDRTGCFVKGSDGEYVMLNGNQTGVLLLEYILSGKVENKTMPENPFVVSTVVSTDLTKKICDAYGAEFVRVLTGFKFIGEQIVKLEENGDKHFVFGFEESYGYLAGTYCRDKDGVASCMLLAEAASYYGSMNMTLLDALEAIYKKYGYYSESQVSVVLKGESGSEKMKSLMEKLRAEGKNLPGGDVNYYMDIQKSERYDGKTDEVTPVDLPKSNVLYYDLPDSWFAIRPSGTEPKIKIYFGTCAKRSMSRAIKMNDELKKSIMDRVNQMLEE